MWISYVRFDDIFAKEYHLVVALKTVPTLNLRSYIFHFIHIATVARGSKYSKNVSDTVLEGISQGECCQRL